jgi:hypothetical protein
MFFLRSASNPYPNLALVAYAGNFFGFGCGVTPGIFFGGVQQIQLRIEGRESGDLGGGSHIVRGSTHFANE